MAKGNGHCEGGLPVASTATSGLSAPTIVEWCPLIDGRSITGQPQVPHLGVGRG
jgi:hypothetical protein